MGEMAVRLVTAGDAGPKLKPRSPHRKDPLGPPILKILLLLERNLACCCRWSNGNTVGRHAMGICLFR